MQVQRIFAEVPHVSVHRGEWKELLALGPFDLIFADIRITKLDRAHEVIKAMGEAAMILMDDLTPREFWPPEWIQTEVPIGQFWINHPQLISPELRAPLKESLMIARKKSQIVEAPHPTSSFYEEE